MRKKCGARRRRDNLQARRARLCATLTGLLLGTAALEAGASPTESAAVAPPSGSGVEVDLPQLPTPDAETADQETEGAATSAAHEQSTEPEAELGDAALPFDAIDPAEIDAQLGASGPAPTRVLTRPVMRPQGVEDPFPDRVTRIRPRDPAILLSVGLGLAAASAVMARLTLLPTCRDERDATTCAVPSSGDIGVRGGRMMGTVAFGIGGATFGALGGRELGRWLSQDAGAKLGRRRNLAVGVGSASLIVGVAGTIAGSVIFGLGVRRSLALASSFEDVGSEPTADELRRVDQTLTEIRTARNGLMLLGASPTFMATGISLLAARPRARRLTLAPQIDGRMLGASATLRF